ncbi:arylsulfatase [Chitinophaga pendula]|uniref:arylsulfatase n=1 Tax=Chitinophaga TaxID=79328 RepID=UPI000BAE8961|nr:MULTISPECIES: arylsulfatase [Chitinophaga]ASZ13839.1 arylsulfatase [Chitinophaga sp. MD30]UCJ08538.1 arylsulfatase [Chitinophaga pendula]
MKRMTYLLIATLLMAANAWAQQRPNIVFILADDLGYGDLGAYGQQKIKTPNIDRLAKQGMLFTQFYAGTSVCAPSRSALLTGQHTGHTYIRGNKEVKPEGQEPLADTVQSYATLLKQAGYVTGAFGKWGLGMVGTSGAPDKKGFDVFYGYNCQRQSHRYYPTHLWSNDQRIDLPGNDLAHKVVYAPEWIQEKTLDFITVNKDRPFFLFVPSVLPHAELQGPDDEYYKQYEHSFEEHPYKGNDYGPNAAIAGYASVAKPRATYAAMVARLDAHVGQILAKLDQLGLTQKTIVIFSSDNGAHREGGADPAFFNSAGNLRGFKRDLYEGGIKTPFIVKWPGTVKPGSRTNFIGAFWDLMPTLVAIAHAPKPRHTDGISFLPTLTGKGKQTQHPYLYWEFHEDGGRQAVRMGRWKGVKQKVTADTNAPLELYDLEKDPREQHDIAAQHPDVVRQLNNYISQAHNESPIFPLLKQ